MFTLTNKYDLVLYAKENKPIIKILCCCFEWVNTFAIPLG